MIKKVLLALKNAYVYLAANPLSHIGFLLFVIAVEFVGFKILKTFGHSLDEMSKAVATLLYISLGPVLWLGALYKFAQLLDCLKDPAHLASEAKKVLFKDLVFANLSMALEAYVSILVILTISFLFAMGVIFFLNGSVDLATESKRLIRAIQLRHGYYYQFILIIGSILVSVGLGVLGRMFRAKEPGDAFLSAWFIFSPKYWIRLFQKKYFFLLVTWWIVVLLFFALIRLVTVGLLYIAPYILSLDSSITPVIFAGMLLLKLLYLVLLYYLAHFTIAVTLEAEGIIFADINFAG